MNVKVLRRNCILCGSKDKKKIFNFTYNFIKNVRKSDPKFKYGWEENTNNWIVSCIQCGCAYVDEIIKGEAFEDSEKKKNNFEEELENFYNPINLVSNLHDINYNQSILINIIKNLKQKKNLKLLDYGSGNSEFSLFKNKYNISEIISYDPLYPNNINDIFKRLKIASKAINKTNDLDNEKFDIIICQSVIEHVSDPNSEISNMKKFLKDDGIIYINNPYMNIKKDLKNLISAKHIKKEDHISCYHIDHINYMMPNIFLKLCKKNDLQLINFWQIFNGTSRNNNFKDTLRTNINSLIHYILNCFGIYYKKQHFFLKLKK